MNDREIQSLKFVGLVALALTVILLLGSMTGCAPGIPMVTAKGDTIRVDVDSVRAGKCWVHSVYFHDRVYWVTCGDTVIQATRPPTED